MTGRILSTHVGSLPQSKAITDLVFAQERGDPVDQQQFDRTIGAAVDDIVAKQVVAGIDLVSDGEMSKVSYATYIKDRITGFVGDSPRTPPADLEQYPNFFFWVVKLREAGHQHIGDPNALDRWQRSPSIHCKPISPTCVPQSSNITSKAAS